MLTTAIAIETNDRRFVDLCQAESLYFVNRMEKTTFGQRLRTAFGNAKYAYIAEKMGVSEATVKVYMAGRVPDAEKLVRIAELTNCNLHWLLTGEGPRLIPSSDVFDLEYEVDKHGDWLDVINEWYEFEGRENPMPETMGASFMGGWHAFDRQQRINAIRDFKAFLDTIAKGD